MNRDELVENLGTIARSGTAAFVQTADRRRQEGHEPDRPVRRRLLFGLHGRRQGRGREPQGRRGARAGAGSRTGRASSRSSRPPNVPRGTRITLHLREGDDEYPRTAPAAPDRRDATPTTSPCRSCSPTATRKRRSTAPRRCGRGRKSEITPEQYKEFYHHVGHGFDEPWLTLHARAEGVLEYTRLLFVPSQKPFDLFDPERKSRVKLYVRRVFITDDGDRAAAGLSALRARRRRLRGPAAQHQPRDAADQPDCWRGSASS